MMCISGLNTLWGKVIVINNVTINAADINLNILDFNKNLKLLAIQMQSA